jgi:hypothetical protein
MDALSFSALRSTPVRRAHQATFSGLTLTRKKAPRGDDNQPIDYLDTFVYCSTPGAVRPQIVMQSLGSRAKRARTLFELPTTWSVLRSDAHDTTSRQKIKPKRGNTRLVVSSSVGPGKDGITLTYNGRAKSLKGIQVTLKLLQATRARARWDFTVTRNGATVPREQFIITRPDQPKKPKTDAAAPTPVA